MYLFLSVSDDCLIQAFSAPSSSSGLRWAAHEHNTTNPQQAPAGPDDSDNELYIFPPDASYTYFRIPNSLVDDGMDILGLSPSEVLLQTLEPRSWSPLLAEAAVEPHEQAMLRSVAERRAKVSLRMTLCEEQNEKESACRKTQSVQAVNCTYERS